MKIIPDGFFKIPDIDNYCINKKGDIFSFKTNSILTKNVVNKSTGQVIVGLMVNKKKKSFTLASLMIRTFFVTSLGKNIFHIVHIDGNRLNNCVENIDVKDNHRRKSKIEVQKKKDFYKISECGNYRISRNKNKGLAEHLNKTYKFYSKRKNEFEEEYNDYYDTL